MSRTLVRMQKEHKHWTWSPTKVWSWPRCRDKVESHSCHIWDSSLIPNSQKVVEDIHKFILKHFCKYFQDKTRFESNRTMKQLTSLLYSPKVYKTCIFIYFIWKESFNWKKLYWSVSHFLAHLARVHMSF